MDVAVILGILSSYFLLSAVPGRWAERKGRNGGLWFLLSLLISPFIAFLFVLGAEDLTRAPCPICAEPILKVATICPHCRSDLKAPPAAKPEPPAATPEPSTPERTYRFGPEMPNSPFRKASRNRPGGPDREAK